MNKILHQAQAYQILALNEEMLKNGYISCEEHDFVRRLQTQKLTNLRRQGTMVSENNPRM